jgi:hypothetical protein
LGHRTRDRIAPRILTVDKAELNRRMDEIEARMGFVPVPDATIERLWELLLAEGVRPQNNELTRELLQMRYGEE